jgi:hypothetical protein
MNPIQLKTIIKEASEEINKVGQFFYGDIYDVSNNHPDRLPQVHLSPIQTTINKIENTIEHNVFLFVLDQDFPDNTPDNRFEIQSNCFYLGNSIINEVINNNTQIQNVNCTPEKLIRQGTFSGYGFQFTVIGKEPC